MKPVRKITAILLSLALLLTLAVMPAAAAEVIASGPCGGSLNWELTDDNVLRIFGTGPMDDTLCTDPTSFEGVKGQIYTAIIEEGATSIGIQAFSGCTRMTRVVMPDTMLHIGISAFEYCYHLDNVVIPASVRQIEAGAFYYCGFLKHLWFSGDAPEMYSLTLANTNPITAYYPAGNPTWTADKLQDYGGSVTWIPYDPAQWNGRIVDFGKIGDDVHWALDSSGQLRIWGKGDMYHYEDATDVPWWNIRTQIKHAVIQSGVTSLSDYTFCRCTEMTEVSLPASLEWLGIQAFSGSGITTVALDPGNESLRCVDNVVYSADMTEIVAMPGLYPGRYVLPETVTELGEYEFAHQHSMTGVTLHDGVTSMDTAAFWDCTALTEITIPAGVTYIGYYTFRDCSALQRICFEGQAPEIEYNACYGLELDGYYPAGDASWENVTWKDFSGRMNWIPYDAPLEPLEVSGDVNSDGSVNSDDAIHLLYHTLFGSSLYPISQAADFDGSGNVDSDDAVYLLYHTLFGDGLYPLN